MTDPQTTDTSTSFVETDVRTDTLTDGTGIRNIKLTHIPSGIHVEWRRGEDYRRRRRLMSELHDVWSETRD